MTAPPGHSRVSQLPPGPGRTVWLASYPKSGNTWVRAILTALGRGDHLFAINQLDSGGQPYALGAAPAVLGLDPRWLIGNESEQLRSTLIRAADGGDGADREPAPAGVRHPLLRKTHELYRAVPASWTWPAETAPHPFPADVTRAALLVVRDPRDVACSYAPFFGLDQAGAVEAMSHGQPNAGRPASLTGEQPWGSWSLHTRSWLAPEVPFPVHLVRYEDLHVDPVATLGPVLAAIGLPVEEDELRRAVERARWERLQAAEQADGFRELSPDGPAFFRRGRSGGWREELPPDLVAAVEADHGAMMARLGYELGSDPQERAELAAHRRSERQAATPAWLSLPADLGLLTQRATLPDRLPGANRPRRWAWITPEATLVRFEHGGALLVRDGHRILVDPGTASSAEPDGDPAWLIQGWGVTLAMLQRGGISLHASVLDVHGRVICVAGDRGAGKSTTAMTLRARGHRLLVDDVALVTVVEEHGLSSAWVRPFARNVHLLPDSVTALGLDDAELLPMSGGRTKSAIRLEPPPDQPRLIDDVVVLTRALDPATADREPSLHPVSGVEKVALVRRHTDRDGLAPLILGQQGYFDRLTQLAGAVRVSELVRPDGVDTMAAVVAAIEGLSSAPVRA